MRIKRKYLPFVTAVCMGLSMGLVMSFVMTIVNVGWVDDFLIRWLKAFAVGALIGVPIALVVVPVVTKQLQKMVID